MLCLYNTPVVHNSEIRFDFVTLSCFGYNHLKHTQPDSMYDGGGTQELLPVKYVVLNLKWTIGLYTFTPVSKCYRSTVVC